MKIVIGGLIGAFIVSTFIVYESCRIDVPQSHIAVLTRRVGLDLENDQVVAPSAKHKGVQLEVLNEGRYFYNPYVWDWRVYPMVEIPAGKLGVRTRLYGKTLSYGHFVATKEDEKGIVEDVLNPGRYPINALVVGNEVKRPKQDYVELVELYEPINVPAGFQGVVTNLAGPLPTEHNQILSKKGFRGVQEKTLDAGTYYLNPFMFRVNLIDCRSQRFNLAENYDMGFPSKDGFWVSLDGIIEFRVKPEKAAEVFVTFNETENDATMDDAIHEELVRKIIMPNARSFCRLNGSNNSGREFIGGQTRTAFQKAFATAMHGACDEQGVEILQALITKINPPQEIALPVRQREVSHQMLSQFREQKLQQVAEAKLATEKALILQKQELVGAEQTVVTKVTAAKQQQQVAILKAEENKVIAEKELLAAKNQGEAILVGKKTEAGLITLKNEAEAIGWATAIEAFGGDGEAFAQFTLLKKLAPSYKQILSNSSDSPLMDIFKNFNKKGITNEK